MSTEMLLVETVWSMPAAPSSWQTLEWPDLCLKVITTDLVEGKDSIIRSCKSIQCLMNHDLDKNLEGRMWWSYLNHNLQGNATREMDVPGKSRWWDIYAHVWCLELRSAPLRDYNFWIFPLPRFVQQPGAGECQERSDPHPASGY